MTSPGWLTCLLVLSIFLSKTEAASDSARPILFPGSVKRPSTPPDNGTSIGEDFLDSELNSLRNINDFATFFNMDLPQTDPFKVNVTISTRAGGQAFAFDGPPPVQELPHADCMPEMTTVPLDLPQEQGVTFFPTCVRVERCGGCCFTSHYACQPTAVDTIQVKVIKVQEDVTVVRKRRRRIRNVESNYVAVDVERHLQCGCDCKFKANQCNLEIHDYNGNYCQCICKDRAKEEACLESRDHFWNNNRCECLCRNTHDCSSGLTFDHSVCSCRNG